MEYVSIYMCVCIYVDTLTDYTYIYESSKKLKLGKIFLMSIFFFFNIKMQDQNEAESYDRKQKADYENQYKIFAKMV